MQACSPIIMSVASNQNKNKVMVSTSLNTACKQIKWW